MTPFRAKDAKTYKGRAWDRAGNRYVRSLGTRDKREANLVQAFLAERRRLRDWRTLDAVIASRLSAIDAYHASTDGTLVATLDELDAAAKEDEDTDLSPLVDQWPARSEKYRRQVRTMIPKGARYPLSRFTRKAISTHLNALPGSSPTRNRYRVAFSQFARWLVEQEHLPSNPVRDVRGFKENDPRMVHYTRVEALAVINRLEWPYCIIEALMFGAGLEVGAVLALRRRDVNLETREVAARGSKTRWRTRTVRVTEDKVWPLIASYMRGCTPDAAPFARITERKALEAHKAACKAAGVQPSTLHDWRHTYAIQALKDGMAPQTVKHQLGHSPHSTMLERVYSAWIPKSDADYAKRETAAPKARRVKA